MTTRHAPDPLLVLVTSALFLLGCGRKSEQLASTSDQQLTRASTTVQLTETPEAFRNPMKGFRPSRYLTDASFKDYEYTSTYKQYIRYSDLESSSSDTVKKI